MMSLQKCLTDTNKTPNPYIMDRLKLMDDASAKYFVGQLNSAISNFCK